MTTPPASSERNALQAQHLPLLLDAWNNADRSRRIRALANSGPVSIATLEAFVITAETGRTSTPAPRLVINDPADPRLPAWVVDVIDRLNNLPVPPLASAFRLMSHQNMRHMTLDLQHDGPVRRVVRRFDHPNDAHLWLASPPQGWRVLFSHVSDLRAYPGERVVAHASLIPAEPFTVADAKALFASQDIDIDPTEEG